MRSKAFFALAVEIGFAGILAIAQTAAPPAGQSSNTPAAANAAKPAVTPKPAAKKPPSQVDSVIQLVKGGMSEGFIVKYLQRNNKPAELTPGDMVKLKDAGVSETIIGVMIDPTSAPTTPAGPSAAEVAGSSPAPVTAPAAVPAPTVVASTPEPEPSSGIQGDWRGVLVVSGTRIPVVIHLAPGGAGTADSPTQRSPQTGQPLMGMPVQYSVSGGQVNATIPAVNGSYSATVNGNQMVGTYSQNGLNYPLTMVLNGAASPVPSPGPAPANRAAKTVSSGDWKSALQARLEQEYPVTQATGDKTDIVTPGAVLTLKKNSLAMYASTSFSNVNTYKGGPTISNGFFGAICKTSRDGSCRIFVKGEKFWVVEVAVKEDGVVFQFLSDPLPDERYHGTLKFPFPKGTQPNADEISAAAAQVLAVVDGAPAAPAPSNVPAGQPLPAIGPPPPPEPALAPIAPPPPPPASVDLGQTKEQVLAALGQPEKIANAGATKQIYFFKNLKVTFLNGKVTDIQ